MKTFFKLFLATFALAITFQITAAKAADSTDVGLVISPPVKEQTVKPGEKISSIIRVTNMNASTNLTVDISAVNFTAGGDNGEPKFLDSESDSSAYALSTWLTVQKNFSLDAGATAEIPYTITVPANAEPGGHFGSVMFSPKVVASSADNAVAAFPRVASLILLTVPGNIDYKGSITSFTSDKNIYTNLNNLVKFATDFNNESAAHVKPIGTINVKNVFNKQVASVNFNEGLGNVLPGSTRLFKTDWQKNMGFGRYVAQAALTFGDNKTAVASYTFWIIPVKETAIALIILILIILTLVYIGKHVSWKKNNNTNNSNE